MRRPIVHFSVNALRGMFASAGEDFRKECFGFAFGKAPENGRSSFSVDLVHHMRRVKQYSKGDNSYVVPNVRAENRIKSMASATGSDILGHFHSHAQYKSSTGDTRISVHDFDRMEKDDHALEIIVSIFSFKGRGSIPWYFSSSGPSLRGSAGRFRFCIRVYGRLPNGNGKKELYCLPIAKSAARILNSICASP